ncbi:response regulator [Luteolibacter yonseiensis]|uniref:Response regulator n=1 Tax=Luteolibacter yonseiensis TaxID=1144680 RepID=A0A934RAE4_9BACT|nr:response regulator [Luteolibacter yonseiensis]MBK1817954.1 response regulator [Luteolibacter yonseiensis]
MKRIIVAEDDFVISKLYQIHFRRNGLHGSFFNTGAGVLESARHQRPDLVILDFELPDIRGPEVMSQLHAIPGCEDVPVVFVTGRATPEVVDNLRKDGAREVFGKPFSPLQLIQLINQLTGEK